MATELDQDLINVEQSVLPVYEAAFAVLNRHQLPVTHRSEVVLPDEYTLYPDIVTTRLWVSGSSRAIDAFRNTTVQPEFVNLVLSGEQRSVAYLPGEYRMGGQHTYYEPAPVQFYRLLDECDWSNEQKAQAIARFWKNEANNWQFQAKETSGFGKELLKFNLREAWNKDNYRGASKLFLLGLSGLEGSAYALVSFLMAREHQQNAEVCRKVAKALLRPYDKMTDQDLPTFIAPAVARVLGSPSS